MPASPPVAAANAPPPESCNARRRVTCAMSSLPQISVTRSGVDLDQFVMRPLDRLLGGHALDRLRVHVDDDVLGDDLGGLAVGWPGMADEPADLGQIAERQQDR